MTEEKRSAKRIPLHLSVKYIDPDSGEAEVGTLRDLSCNGICFVSRKKLDVGAIVNATVEANISEIKPLNIKLEVKRSKALTEKFDYEIGGVITEVL